MIYPSNTVPLFKRNTILIKVLGMLSGATAGLCQVIATNPMEITKIQLQLQGSRGPNAKQITAIDVVRQLGLRGMYRGTFATLARDVPFSLTFFSMVSWLKNMGIKPGEATPLSTIFASGIIAGGFAAALVTPADVVKTRLQVISQPGDPVYKGQLDCYRFVVVYFLIYILYRSIIRNEGVGALFKGVVPRVLIVSPLFAISIFIYEAQKMLFG